jgi:hypothetical protein
MTRAALLFMVIALAAPRALAAPATFHAEPAVSVVQTAVNTASGASTIILHNDTTAPIVASAITPEPGCDAAVHLAPLTNFSLAAGQTRTLTLTCAAAPAGMQRCNFRVRDPGGAPVLAFEAVCASAGEATLVAQPAATIDFGTVAVGASQPQTLQLTNTSAAAITALAIETTDLDGNFTVQAPCNPDARECDAHPTAFAAGATLPITVACTPRAAGAQTAQLFITTSAGGRLAAPITLTCNATAAPGPALSAPAAPIDLDTVEVLSATATTTIQLANTGGAPLSLLGVQVVDAGTGAAIDWTYTAHAPCNPHIPDACTLNAGDSVALDLVFDPSGLGARDANLLINFHDTVDRSLAIPLRGQGGGATLDLLGGQTVLDLGTLPIGASGAIQLQVTNRGTRDLLDAVINFTDPGPFTVAASTTTGGLGFSIAAGGVATFTVTCTPTDARPQTAQLSLLANDVQSPPIALTLRCTGDDRATLVADPPALLLGEVRTNASVATSIAVSAVAAATRVASTSLDPPLPGLTTTGAPATTPFTLTATAAPTADGALASQLVLATDADAHALAIPILGSAVTAAFSVPSAVSLGTFCVQQATTPRTLPLVSTGTATLGLDAPALANPDSPFDLMRIAPVVYPTTLPALGSAFVAITPKRQAVAGIVTDDLIWTTDGTTLSHTTLTATFITDGVAIAPSSIDFGDTPIHLDTPNAHQVTIQNCGAATLQLDPPQLPAPFSIDSPSFPTTLTPGATATFSVGFHPTQRGAVTKTLVLTSPQLDGASLMVTLTGNGTTGGLPGDAGTSSATSGATSFYACGSCTANDPAAALVFTLAVVIVVARRPRYRRRHG